MSLNRWVLVETSIQLITWTQTYDAAKAQKKRNTDEVIFSLWHLRAIQLGGTARQERPTFPLLRSFSVR